MQVVYNWALTPKVSGLNTGTTPWRTRTTNSNAGTSWQPNWSQRFKSIPTLPQILLCSGRLLQVIEWTDTNRHLHSAGNCTRTIIFINALCYINHLTNTQYINLFYLDVFLKKKFIPLKKNFFLGKTVFFFYTFFFYKVYCIFLSSIGHSCIFLCNIKCRSFSLLFILFIAWILFVHVHVFKV